MSKSKVYLRKRFAETRMIKLMKDGLTSLTIEKTVGGWTVSGDPGLKGGQVTTFGLYMERTEVVEAALSVDPKDINQFDVGETHARPASEIMRSMWRAMNGR